MPTPKTLATPAYCFDVCKGGPILLVYPDGVWYGAASPEQLDRIVDEHLLGGQVVEELVLSRTPEGPCGWGRATSLPRANPGQTMR